MVMSNVRHTQVPLSEEPRAEEPRAEEQLYADGMLRVTRTVTPGWALVRLEGDLDVTNRTRALSALRRALRRARPLGDRLIVDVGGVRFIDVAGLRALLDFTEDAAAVLRDVPAQMRRLMDLLDLPPLDRADSRTPAPGGSGRRVKGRGIA
ncbi:STAS domain-containing protein [Nonomuraea sp. MCN248]|uniref:STAS domain-containing protein n=1 Tax=Nonomuraea corallina TaxID=2989783 RepID=A0ABT4S8P0_9ACTN|nr:STAS domain-containing protein [Nonomuraea corallina]MDA0633534.1 STAS domain-containing protein [Nonomuraea corallina]